MLAVHLAKRYCLPILLYGYEVWHMSPSDKHKVEVVWNNSFNAGWQESAKPLSFYYNKLSASLLVDQRKMILYNKTLHNSNTVLRVIMRSCVELHFNEIQILASPYFVSPGHSTYAMANKFRHVLSSRL